ncbi:MAG: hypothetical protein V3R75_01335 [Alphaproteobacteria bacterium]
MPRSLHRGAGVGKPGHYPILAQDRGQSFEIADAVLKGLHGTLRFKDPGGDFASLSGGVGIDKNNDKIDRRDPGRIGCRSHVDPGRAVPIFDHQTVPVNGLDMDGPKIQERYVIARRRKPPTVEAAHGPGADDGKIRFVSHASPSLPRFHCAISTIARRPVNVVIRIECPQRVCAVVRRRFSSGCKSHPAIAPAGSNRSSHGGDEMAEAFG